MGVKEALVGSWWLNTWVSYAKNLGHTLTQASWVILFSPKFIECVSKNHYFLTFAQSPPSGIIMMKYRTLYCNKSCSLSTWHSQEPVPGQACNPPDPHWFFLSFSRWRSFTVLGTKVALFSYLMWGVVFTACVVFLFFSLGNSNLPPMPTIRERPTNLLIGCQGMQ